MTLITHPRTAGTWNPMPLVAPDGGADGAPAVLILSGSVGAGHDGAAHELARRLRDRGVDVDVRDYLEALPRWFRFFLREGYTASVSASRPCSSGCSTTSSTAAGSAAP